MTAGGKKLTAIWRRGPVFWELVITDEKGRIVRPVERSSAPVQTAHPKDTRLIAMGLTPVGKWKHNSEDGSWSCPVRASGSWDVRLLGKREAG